MLDRTDLSFLVGLGKGPDEHAADLLHGDEAAAMAALEYLDANLQSALLGAALGLLGDRDAAEDAVRCALYEVHRNREATAAAFARRHQADPGASAYAFVRAQIFRTLYRRACDRLRRARRQAAVPLDDAHVEAMLPQLTDPLLHKLLAAAIESLDPGARLAVASRLAGCETHDEAARFMGTTRAEAAVAWRRALYRLRLAPSLALYVRSLDAVGT